MNAWLRVWHRRFLLRRNTVPIFLNSIIYSAPLCESSTGHGSDHEPDVERPSREGQDAERASIVPVLLTAQFPVPGGCCNT